MTQQQTTIDLNHLSDKDLLNYARHWKEMSDYLFRVSGGGHQGFIDARDNYETACQHLYWRSSNPTSKKG